jgi:hypothetical protein
MTKLESTPSSEGFRLHCSRVNREISAVYLEGEIRLKLVIKIADVHPLKTPVLEFRETMGVSEKRAKFWMLSMTAMLVGFVQLRQI